MSEPQPPPPAPAPPAPAAPAPPPPPPPELVPALAAFERGDFRSATSLARGVLAATPAPSTEVRAAANELLARMAPDPWAVRIAVAALVLLAVVAGLYIR